MRAKWADYNGIKAKVSIEDVLGHYGLLDGLTRRGDQLSGCCPIHKGSRKGQFSVSVSKNAFKCFSGECGAKGNQIDLVAAMEGVSFREAALLLQEWFGIESGKQPGKRERERRTSSREKESGGDEAAKAARAVEEPKENKPLSFVLNLESSPYLEQRGLSPETISYFGLGLCARGSMQGRIAIPIQDHEGKLVAYAGRWAGEDSKIPEGEGKYKLPAGFHKSLVVYNLHRIPPGTKQVIIVEGFFSVFWLHQIGYRNVVSTMGSSISGEQLELLRARVQGVQVFFDGDSAGERGALDVGSQLYASGLWCRLVKCPENKQPDHLSTEELKKLLG